MLLMNMSDKDLPLLKGDGVHDDTEALQAFLDGKPVRVDDNIVVFSAENYFRIHHAYLKVTSTILINPSVDYIDLKDSYVQSYVSGPAFRVEDDPLNHITVRHLDVTSRSENGTGFTWKVKL